MYFDQTRRPGSVSGDEGTRAVRDEFRIRQVDGAVELNGKGRSEGGEKWKREMEGDVMIIAGDTGWKGKHGLGKDARSERRSEERKGQSVRG